VRGAFQEKGEVNRIAGSTSEGRTIKYRSLLVCFSFLWGGGDNGGGRGVEGSSEKRPGRRENRVKYGGFSANNHSGPRLTSQVGSPATVEVDQHGEDKRTLNHGTFLVHFRVTSPRVWGEDQGGIEKHIIVPRSESVNGTTRYGRRNGDAAQARRETTRQTFDDFQ